MIEVNQFLSNMRRLLGIFVDRFPESVILVGGIVQRPLDFHSSLVDNYNNRLAHLVSSFSSKVVFVEVSSKFCSKVTSFSTHFEDDRVHFNELGNTVFKQLVREAFTRNGIKSRHCVSSPRVYNTRSVWMNKVKDSSN